MIGLGWVGGVSFFIGVGRIIENELFIYVTFVGMRLVVYLEMGKKTYGF